MVFQCTHKSERVDDGKVVYEATFSNEQGSFCILEKLTLAQYRKFIIGGSYKLFITKG